MVNNQYNQLNLILQVPGSVAWFSDGPGRSRQTLSPFLRERPGSSENQATPSEAPGLLGITVNSPPTNPPRPR